MLHNLRARIETAFDESYPYAFFVVRTGHAEPTDVPNPRWQRNSHSSGGAALVGGRVVGVIVVRDRLRRPDAKWGLRIGLVPRDTRRMERHCNPAGAQLRVEGLRCNRARSNDCAQMVAFLMVDRVVVLKAAALIELHPRKANVIWLHACS